LEDALRSAATAYLGAPGGPVESFIGNAGAAMGADRTLLDRRRSMPVLLAQVSAC